MNQSNWLKIRDAGNNIRNIGICIILNIIIGIIEVIHVCIVISNKSNPFVPNGSSQTIEGPIILYGTIELGLTIVLIINIFLAADNLLNCTIETSTSDINQLIPTDRVDSDNNQRNELVANITHNISQSGKKMNGGIIVYTDSSGEHGLVCSLQDLEKSEWETAKVNCSKYSIEEYHSWKLPSKEELNQLFEYLHKKRLGEFTSNFYWSDTESKHNEAKVINFSSGFQTDSNKEFQFCVRAVRYF